jgi:hypothetical protein
MFSGVRLLVFVASALSFCAAGFLAIDTSWTTRAWLVLGILAAVGPLVLAVSFWRSRHSERPL